METNGRKFLKVTGILLIVLGGLGLISSLFSLVGANVLIGMGVGAGIVWLSIIFSIVVCAFELFAGIYGVKNCAVIPKAKSCVMIGIAMIVLQIASSVLGYIYSLKTANILTTTAAQTGSAPMIISTVIGLVIGLVIPVIYIYGAMLNEKSE